MTAFQSALVDQQAPERIRSRPCPTCYLCGRPGNLVYEGLRDRLFGAAGSWNFKLCTDPDCGLMWLDPIPVEEEIGKAYAKYYTHAEVPTQRTALAKALRKCASVLLSLANPVHGERERLSLMCLDKVKPGKLLDVGCGNGVRIARLRSLGWDVYGQDVDPVAIAYARETLGLEAHLGPLEEMPFAKRSFDCITLNHVIEHAHDPVALLKECGRLLKAGGLLMIVTPNSESFASRRFGASWRGLEPPRHIHVFSPKTLSAVATRAGLKVSGSWTTVANATTFWRGSMMIKNNSVGASNLRDGPLTRVRALSYLYRCIFQHVRSKDSGEECVLRATH